MITIPGAWKFYLCSSLFQGTRMGIGATAVIYMLSEGLSLSDVATIKIVQGFVIFFAEVPTGMVADLFGRRFSSILSVVCAIASFLLFYFGSNIYFFGAAEVFNALAIAFWSGAFEALVVDEYKERSKKNAFLEVLFSKINMYGALATMFGGAIGGFIADINLKLPFVFSSALGVLTIFSLLLLIKNDRIQNVPDVEKASSLWKRVEKANASLKENVLVVHEYCFKDRFLAPFFMLQIAIQFMYQPVFHYWQPFFKSFEIANSMKSLGYIFFAYVGMNFLVSWLISSLMKTNRYSVHFLLLIEMLLIGLCFSIMTFVEDFWIALAAFLLMQGCGSNLRSLLGAGVNKVIPSKQRASILSTVSFVSRLGMLLALGIIHFTAKHVDVAYLYGLSIIGSLILIPTYLVWNQALEARLKQEASHV